MKIHGKEYVEVKDRILQFRNEEKYEGWSLRSDIIGSTDKTVTIKAFISNKEDLCIATGIAHENMDDGLINKTSHIENCETSAWGRALANLGIGVIDGVASADEVYNAVSKQEHSGYYDKNVKKDDEPSEKQKAFLISKKAWVDGMTKREAMARIGELM